MTGLQGADWYEKLESQRSELTRQVADFSQSPLIDVPRLERALNNWPSGGWHRPEIFREYNLALTRGVTGGRFLRWFETAN